MKKNLTLTRMVLSNKNQFTKELIKNYSSKLYSILASSNIHQTMDLLLDNLRI